MDSVDSVLVNLANQKFQILAKISTTIPKDLKIQTLNATNSENLSIQTIESLDNQFGILFAKAASNLLDINSINKSNIKAIGSHGQTIKHSPYPPLPYSLQVGSPEKKLEQTYITYNFMYFNALLHILTHFYVFYAFENRYEIRNGVSI